jgi:nucleoside-diphosphate-sugar epimerase
VGLFLDYYGMPHIPSHLTPLVVFIDMAHKTAALPGTTGDELVSFTYTQDLGKFVVAAMSLEHWPEALHCYSENTSLSRILQIAEDVRGMLLPAALHTHSLFN